MKYYVYLGLAICSEVFGTTMLKLSEGFTNLLPSLGVIVGFGIAFVSLGLSLKKIPISIAYAIWSGIGTAATAVIGILTWNEPFNFSIFIGLVLIIGGVILLNHSKPGQQEEKVSS